ncbi:hypothetical protein [Rhizobium leguminosarum]|nr:hypothetical protein [Rhizobium leguminosarum]
MIYARKPAPQQSGQGSREIYQTALFSDGVRLSATTWRGGR